MIKTKCLVSLLLVLYCHGTVADDTMGQPYSQGTEPEIDESLNTAGNRAPTSALEILPDGAFSVGAGTPRNEAPVVEDFYPARLSVALTKQHVTACQYWLKLENRLPFMIRNLALRFSTYLESDFYNRPIMFDSEIVSFSRIRPTDTQFRDIFYEHVNCDDLKFIRVEDTGRCALGGLTKFSAQEGDCAKYVEVEPSDMICIFMGDQAAEAAPDTEGEVQVVLEPKTERNPCGLITQQDVDDLLSALIRNYEAGDRKGFLELFSEQVETNDNTGISHVALQYGEVFRTTKQRSMRIDNVSWKPLMDGTASVSMNSRIKVNKGAGWSDEQRFAVTIRAYRRGGRLVIARMRHDKL